MDLQTFINANGQATAVILRRLVEAVEKEKGIEGKEWLAAFRKSCVSDLQTAKTSDGSARDPDVVATAVSIVEMVTHRE
ncbi:hypothetical protein [Agrobacterium sp. SUL3]|uniref:hypothetical protein n=1 Tax=Agrobacterium sp. SUL3 TaxID=1701910 RepID=UPI00069B5B67|nr:hypothetical protein [Agrobacterium sp. SUL3]KNY36101.1 hypothetical protein AKG12_03685 [Agrobacterium sp. SUL3]